MKQSRKQIMRKTQSGFTLIELMIAVAIVAIISRLAYTSYADSVLRSKRTDAKVALTHVASELERCYTMNGQYSATTTPAKACSVTGTATDVNTAASLATTPIDYTKSDKGYYTIGGTITGATYTLTATPNGFTDPNCNVYTLTQTGVWSVSGAWSSDIANRPCINK